MKIRRLTLEKHISHSALVKRRERSKTQPIGQRHGDELLRQLSSLSLTEEKSLSNIRGMSRSSSKPDNPMRTKELSHMTLPSEISSVENKHHYLPIVFESPVWSRFSCQIWQDRGLNRSSKFHNVQDRRPNRWGPVYAKDWSKPVLTGPFSTKIQESKYKLQS